MRDPERIDRILNQLREVWVKVPDWRLGQLLVNAVNPKQPCPDVFYLEDRELEKLLSRLSKEISSQ